jgi:hypothetical protein
MLGSVMDAEDVEQEAYLRLCIDQLRSARAQRKTYVGPWQHTVSLDAVRSGGSGVWSYTSNNLSVLFVPGDRGAVTEAGGPRTIHPR